MGVGDLHSTFCETQDWFLSMQVVPALLALRVLFSPSRRMAKEAWDGDGGIVSGKPTNHPSILFPHDVWGGQASPAVLCGYKMYLCS